MALWEVFVVDAQKRQKMILAGVAVLALGAGSYWYLGRDSGGGKAAGASEGPVVRKAKAVTEKPTEQRKKSAKAVTKEEPTAVERKERAAPEETTVERKKKREEKTREKKKVVAPAA